MLKALMLHKKCSDNHTVNQIQILSYKRHFKTEHEPKYWGEKNTHYFALANTKKVGLAILISTTIGFTEESCYRDQQGHFLILKKKTQYTKITPVNVPQTNLRIHSIQT
ncbi:hypothetical protein GDO86_007427 [Hymenochirus boettgeri]|uniref:Uncharacterized protein n=1 Tax=Hymenochirus boettgeri TaxID=247094 RepID=A0A8T2J1S2_9PIPI|nr:hypothetical protein GDO86_007427 [Hymenochirus boettgeri]